MDTIIVSASGDQYQGDPQFTVTVDGVQVGGVYDVSALYSQANFEQFTLSGNLNVTANSVISVNYINDASGPGGDRNLFIGSVSVDGRSFQGSVAALGGNGVLSDSGALWSDGSLNFDMAAPAPDPAGGLSMLGVNLSGAEEYGAHDPNTALGVDYAYPTNEELQYYASKSLNVIRLPFQWERLQPTLNGPLSSADLTQIDRVVSYANSLGMKVILDPHNYAAYDGNPIGSAATPISAFDDLWSQLAAHYAGNAQVLFGLMNEPNLPAAIWLDAANSAIAAIRATGANSQKILVSGIDSDTSSSWLTSGNALTLGNAIVDPANNCAFEVHEYFDSDGSGVGGDTVSTAIGVQRMVAITEWARDNGKQLFLGEFGSNSDPTALAALKNTLSFMTANSDVWLGGTEWEASTSYNYYFNIAPVNGVDSPQTDVLDQFAPSNALGMTGLVPVVDVDDNATATPFVGITITNLTSIAADNAKITLTSEGRATDANGSLSGAGLTHTGVGTYTLAGVASTPLSSRLAALVFTPTAHQTTLGAATTTNLQVTVSNADGSANSQTTVAATAVATAPNAAGLTPTTLFDDATANPFIGLAITDPDQDPEVTAAIRLTSGGMPTDIDGKLGGPTLIKAGPGFYNLAAAPPTILARELAALTFTPTAQQVAPGGSVVTGIALALSEAGATTTLTTTTTTTAAYAPPIISDLSPTLFVTADATLAPFSSTQVTDLEPGAITSAKLVLSSDGMATNANGVLSGSGLTTTGIGSYSLSATTPGSLTSALQALIFVPTNDQALPGGTINTLLTISAFAGNAMATASTMIETKPPPTAASINSITVDLSEDAYFGNAECFITIDGHVSGGLKTVTSLHDHGQTQAFQFAGNFGNKIQDISIQFINDAYGGTPSLDRNLYVDAISLNGTVIHGSSAALYTDSIARFALTIPGL